MRLVKAILLILLMLGVANVFGESRQYYFIVVGFSYGMWNLISAFIDEGEKA